MVIYWDIVFILNIFMNFIILWLTAVTASKNVHLLRLCLGAITGSIFLFALFYPSLHFFFTFSMKFLLSLLRIIITFFPSNFKDLIKLLVYFYIVSFIIGGAAFGIFYFTGVGVNMYNGILILKDGIVPWWVLIISILLVAVLMKFFLNYIQKKFFKEQMLAQVTIFLYDKFSEVKALIDTGNNLYDPFSNAPVIVVEYGVLKNLLSKELQDVFEKEQEINLYVLSEKLIGSQWATRFRLIPFSSIGKSNGILVGFKPDKIIVKTNEEVFEIKESIVGIYNNILSSEGNYSALLNPDILKS